MKRLEEIKKNMFKNLSDKAKILLILNYWSTFSRQSYLSIIVFFIDKNWNYHEILIDFEYMKKKHTKENLTKMIEKVLVKHNIQACILAITTNNVFNNVIFFLKLVNNLFAITNCVNITSKNNEDEKNDDRDKICNIVHVFCFAHVLQLTLQAFLNSVRVNSTNDELQKNWNDQENVRTINQADKKLSMTFAKINTIFY
jgi:dipeptide/tripeptide permease